MVSLTTRGTKNRIVNRLPVDKKTDTKRRKRKLRRADVFLYLAALFIPPATTTFTKFLERQFSIQPQQQPQQQAPILVVVPQTVINNEVDDRQR